MARARRLYQADILSSAYFIDQDARRWTLYQDGDLWAVADDMPDDQKLEFFGEVIK